MEVCRTKDVRRKGRTILEKLAVDMPRDALVDHQLGIPKVVEFFGVDKDTTKRVLSNVLYVSENLSKLADLEQTMRNARYDIYRQCEKLHKAFATLSKDDSNAIGIALDGGIPRDKLPLHLQYKYDKAKVIIDSYQNKLVELGLLNPEDRKQNYISRIYEDHLNSAKVATKFFKKLGKRKNLTIEDRIELGQIHDASAIVPLTINKQRTMIMTASFLKDVADTFAKEEPLDGYVKVPDIKVGGSVKQFGALSGKYIPEDVYNALRDADMIVNDVKGDIKNVVAYLVDHIKANLTIKNPPTHLFNILSNLNIAFVNGDMTALGKVTSMYLRDREAFNNLVELARENGLNTQLTYLDDLVLKGEFEKTESPMFFVRALKSLYMAEGTKLGDFARKAYEWEDAIFKVANFQRNLDAGMSPREAMKEANYTYVDYTTPIPPFLKSLDRYGIYPFLHYVIKSTPAMARTILKSKTNTFRWMTMQFALYGLGWSVFNDDDDKYKPKWAADDVNMFSAKKWGEISDGWFLNVGRAIPAMKLTGLDLSQDFLGLSSGFVQSLYNILINKTPLGYPISDKYDSNTEIIAKKLLTAAETFLPPITMGRYAIRGARIIGGDDSIKNHYNEPLTLTELFLRAFGVRHFNKDKELKYKHNAKMREYEFYKNQQEYDRASEAYSKALELLY